jgi:hypothetical protein
MPLSKPNLDLNLNLTPALTLTLTLYAFHAQAKRKISSVPLLPLCIHNVEIVRGMAFSLASLPRLQTAIAYGQTALLVFPAPDAVVLPLLRGPVPEGAGTASLGVDLAVSGEPPLPECEVADSLGLDLAASGEPPLLVSGEPPLLVLVDGTWPQARQMVRHSPEIVSACRRAMFRTELHSQFEALRREPAPHCMCTLEAAAYALRALGRTSDAQRAAGYLEASLRELVGAQLRHARPAPPRPTTAKRRAAQQALAPPPSLI